MFLHNGVNEPESKTTHMFHPQSGTFAGQSLMSVIALLAG